MGRVSRYQSRHAGNTATFSTVDTLTSGSGADTIVLTGTIANASIDLGAGNATLALGNGTNSATVSNTETITGGTGNDTITLGTAFTTGMAVDLAGGANKLSLGAFTNTGTVSNVNTLIGGTAADTATLGAATVNGSADLGTGSDTLQLANFTNRISVTNTATVMGGTGDDTIILTGSTSSMVVGGSGMNFVTGDAGADEFVFDQNLAGNVSTVTNFSAAKGGTGLLWTPPRAAFLPPIPTTSAARHLSTIPTSRQWRMRQRD
jgi:hypothetical protein